jgi:hypothetical protein
MASQVAVNLNICAVILVKCWAGCIEVSQFEFTAKDLVVM